MAILAIPSVSVIRADEAVTPAARVAAAAEKAVSSLRETSYQHKIQIDASAGRFNTDCSGFVEFVLREAAPADLSAVARTNSHKRPLAEDFYQTFHAASTQPGEPWRQIDRIADVQPGDILAWKSLSHEDGDHTDTGHVMVIVSTPIMQDQPNEFAVAVIDATKSPHDRDSRKAGDTGVGRGTIYLETGSDGHAAGYHWKSPSGRAGDNPIAIGRPGGE